MMNSHGVEISIARCVEEPKSQVFVIFSFFILHSLFLGIVRGQN